MKFFLLLVLFLAALLILKICNYFIELKQQSICKQIDTMRKNSGYLSIKDLNDIDFNNLFKLINTYLIKKGYKDIKILKDSDTAKPTLICSLNEDAIYVSLQSYIDTTENTSKNSNIDIFIANMLKENCKKGILFTNFTFSTDDIKAINNFNENSSFDIKLIDGYELSRFIRNINVLTIRGEANV